MAYHIEGKDIVINGFEKGIGNSIYEGVADMRNMEIISVPGEASTQYAEVAAAVPPVVNAAAFTASASADTFTVASTTGYYQGMAIVLNTNSATGISTGAVYYVINISGVTFQLALAPLSTSVINITGNGSGTFTTYQYGNQRAKNAVAPMCYWEQRTSAATGLGYTLLVDGSLYAWIMYPAAQGNVPANTLIFLGNIGGVGASNAFQAGISVWNGYIFLIGNAGANIDYASYTTLTTSSVVSAWSYGWKTVTPSGVNSRIGMLVSQEDGNMYFTTASGLGSLLLNPGKTFDPTDSTTYAYTQSAIQVASGDRSTCLAELSSTILVGGEGSFLYVWDKLSLGFNYLINVPDEYTTNIVATSQTAYVFTGTRGRIFITNGSGIDLFKKIPDYVTGVVTPYIIWQDANFDKNQLYFTFAAYSNANVLLTTVAGGWAIDLDLECLRLVNKTTNTGYTGITTMCIAAPSASISNNNPAGTGLILGWYSSGVYGVDIGSTAPYTNYESYLETEMIPVGTFLDPFSPTQIEWKTSAPIGANGTSESIRVKYRQNVTDAFTTVGTTTSTTGQVADYYQANFQKVQWVQLRVESASNATTPTLNRLTELRIRDWPSGKDSNK